LVEIEELAGLAIADDRPAEGPDCIDCAPITQPVARSLVPILICGVIGNRIGRARPVREGMTFERIRETLDALPRCVALKKAFNAVRGNARWVIAIHSAEEIIFSRKH